MSGEEWSERRWYGVVFGEVLRLLRERAGLSQAELVAASGVGVSQATASRFEVGTVLPNLWELRRLAGALKVSHVRFVQAVEVAFAAGAKSEAAPERVVRAAATTAAFRALEEISPTPVAE